MKLNYWNYRKLFEMLRFPQWRYAAPLALMRSPLHIFVRTPHTEHAAVEVSAGASVAQLKDAVIAKLQLAAPPQRLRLLREAGGVPLASCERLADQGVGEGCRVVAVVLEPEPAPVAPAPRLPPPYLSLGDDPAAASSPEEYWGA